MKTFLEIKVEVCSGKPANTEKGDFSNNSICSDKRQRWSVSSASLYQESTNKYSR